MNTIRVTFEDGVIYDWPVPRGEIETESKSNLMVEAMNLAESWRNLVSAECDIENSFIVKVEWYAYNLNHI